MIELTAELSTSEDLTATLSENVEQDAELGETTIAGVSSWNGQTGPVTYTAPVTSVNGQTGAVSLAIPTKTSELTNNSDFTTKTYVDGLVGDLEALLATI